MPSLPRKKHRSRKKRKASNSLSFEKLEPKNLLAGMYLNPTSGDLTIWGGSADEVGRVVELGTTQLRASMTGLPTMDYAKSDVSRIIFIGHQGDDLFRNSTDISGLLYGNDGNDMLFGGTVDDVIVGANGDDLLQGGDGEDRLIGGNGADRMLGQNGNDKMFGNDGVNEMFGGNGDDLIFGGNDVDTINGDGGLDVIIGLEGDDILTSGAGGVAGSRGDSMQSDLILGLGGNDMIFGTSGLDILYGGVGDDIISGGSGENRMHGQNGDDTLNGGSGIDLIWGQNGNDELNGGNGNDFLDGGQDEDIIRGGSGNDTLIGNLGDDSLYGEAGNDNLEGDIRPDANFPTGRGTGNDGLFGGVGGNDVIRGGRGNDRFLIFGSDSPADLSNTDATITFRNDGSGWNNKEIEVADIGLRQLHHRTDETRIFKDPLDTNPMSLYKVPAGSLGNGAEADGFNELRWDATWEADGTIISETYTRRISIADWDESNQVFSEDASLTVIHEIAHSFDSAFEIGEVVPSKASIFNSFLNQSGWETSNPGSGHTRAPGQTQEPFDRTYVRPNYVLNTHTWWRNNSAEFARNYGATNPQEDFATVWESLFVEAIVENPGSGDAAQVPGKVSLINNLLNSL